MWQELREELYPQGLEIVTVALDTRGLEAALPFIEAAKPTHPSLIDQAHLLDELFGVVNVPSGVWIDEEGVIVRPAERAGVPQEKRGFKFRLPENPSPYVQGMYEAVSKMAEANKVHGDTEKYFPALRDWAANGAKSRHVLTPDQVVERSRPRSLEEALGAAHFELGQYLYREGKTDLAVAHFKESHRLQPDNWTYRRQAWSMADPLQGPTDLYESDWLTDVRKIGAENYYAPLDMD